MIALKSEVENNFEMGHPACVLTRGGKQNNCQFIAKITESFCGGVDTSVTGGFHACQKLLRKSGIKVQIYKRFATINGSEPINNSFITGCFEVRLELYRCNEMSARLYVHKGGNIDGY